MKKLILLLLCLYPFMATGAQYYIVSRSWEIPVTREDGSVLTFDEISHYTMYRVNCHTGVSTGEEILVNIYAGQTISFWMSDTPVDCFKMTTTDSDGRLSKYSEMFQAVEWNAPEPPGCGLP